MSTMCAGRCNAWNPATTCPPLNLRSVKLTRLRYRSLLGEGTTSGVDTFLNPPILASASVINRPFQVSWSSYETCCNWHPPHSVYFLHGGFTRDRAGSKTSTSDPLAHRGRMRSTLIRARSPSVVRGTKTTRPSGKSAMPDPPAPIPRTSTSTSSFSTDQHPTGVQPSSRHSEVRYSVF